MASLTQDENGNYRSRKRLPDDVRDEYGRLYGARHEAKFFAPKTTKSHEAKRLFGDWLAEVEGRIASIRAARDGTGISLTSRQARKLAGDWYDWFLARRDRVTHWQLDEWRDKAQEAMMEFGYDPAEFDDLCRDEPELLEIVHPVVSDLGETAQFLALNQLALTSEARKRFLDFVYEDFAAALKRMERLLEGDHGPDKYRERFPIDNEATDRGVTPWQLFERWVAERQPAAGTVESWRYPFRQLAAHFQDRTAASILPEEADQWVKNLVTSERSAGTVKKTWLNAANTVFRWALEHKLIPHNPFGNAKVTVPKKKKVRERSFRSAEIQTILAAASAVTDTSTAAEAAKRWVPWVCAYTGARPSEITQLRKIDVVEEEHIQALKITPDAGTVKSGAARIVPLHEHLIAQGFLGFVTQHRDGPLFYNPGTNQSVSTDPIKRKKPRYFQARQRLAAWVRSLGVDDLHVSPNHAWRHTFKRIADRVGISERMSDYITGNAPKSVGASYGAPSVSDMAEALKKFPRYEIETPG